MFLLFLLLFIIGARSIISIAARGVALTCLEIVLRATFRNVAVRLVSLEPIECVAMRYLSNVCQRRVDHSSDASQAPPLPCAHINMSNRSSGRCR